MQNVQNKSLNHIYNVFPIKGISNVSARALTIPPAQKSWYLGTCVLNELYRSVLSNKVSITAQIRYGTQNNAGQCISGCKWILI